MNDVPEHMVAFTAQKNDNHSWYLYKKERKGPFPFAKASFDGFRFFKRVFGGCVFESCTFTNCGFDSAHLQSAQFIKCTFSKCSFEHAICAVETTRFDDCTFASCEHLGFVLNALAPAEVRCVDCKIAQINITEKSLTRWEFKNCSVNSSGFPGCKISDLIFSGEKSATGGEVNSLTLTKAIVGNLSFAGTLVLSPNLADSVVNKLGATDCSIKDLNVSGCRAEIKFEECILNGGHGNPQSKIKLTVIGKSVTAYSFNGADLSESTFARCDIGGCNFQHCDLSRSVFRSCFISGCHFSSAKLHGMLVDCERLGTGNDFSNAKTKGFRIARYSLEYLGEKHGNLSNGQKMEMEIIDNVTTLRLSFSGIWQLIHLAALSAFIAPYVGYLVQIILYNRYMFSDTDGAIKSTLFGGMWEYVRTAGHLDGKTNWFYLGVFFVMLIFNVLRGVLLFKTKHYELKQECTGLPMILPLEFNWRKPGEWTNFRNIALWYFVFLVLAWFNIVAAVIHTAFFVFSPVILPPTTVP